MNQNENVLQTVKEVVFALALTLALVQFMGCSGASMDKHQAYETIYKGMSHE